jgi:cytidylate kinase
VLITASPSVRARRLGEKRVRDEDAARADYLERFYGVEQELPTHYDVVVNTDALSTVAAADIVIAAIVRATESVAI